MAVSSPSESGQNEIWWASWLSSAREKSVSALNATKRDLAEFVSVLGNDTKAVVEEASANINKMLHSPTPDPAPESPDQNDQKRRAPSIMDVQAQAPYDRSQAELFSAQNSTETYLLDPSSQDEEYKEWRSTFSIQSHQSDISNLLVSCSHVRTKHSQLVPAKVSYENFWMRYFYKEQQLQKEEKRRADLMARASNRSQDQLQWDEDVEDGEPYTVIGNPLLLKAESSSHQRSESSTDSFVCVSEETGLDGERPLSLKGMDSDSWEQVGSESGGGWSRDSKTRLSEIGEEEDITEKLDKLFLKVQSPLQSIENVGLGPERKDGEERERKDDGDSNSSDWEEWND